MTTQITHVKTRFAPSPTGFLHIGGARTALFNWLYARHQGGMFVLRIEDTDQQRSTEESTQAILDAMTWLGLDWDEGPFFQAQRVENHRSMVQKLLKEGKAYYCTCTPEELEAKRKTALAEGRKPKYDGTCRDKNLPRSPDAAVRFRCPETGSTMFHDLIKGNIVINNEELDDLIIERRDGYPTYNFAVVVDDAEMGITHVLRGDDHVNNTPKQILLYEALEYAVPQFAHVPMILGSDKTRLSKRHGATSVMAYKDMGYLPEALVNYLVRLGWAHGDQEIFRKEELVDLFTLESVGRSAAVFNPDKLLWLNQHYIKEYSADRLTEEMFPFWDSLTKVPVEKSFALNIIHDLQGRAKTLVELAEGSRFYFQEDLAYEEEAIRKFFTSKAGEHLEAIARGITDLTDYTKEGIEAFLRELVKKYGVSLKDVAQPLRVALTGKTVSPGIDDVMVTLGKEKTIARLRKAVDFICHGSSLS